MANVRHNNYYSHSTCTTEPSFNVDGSKTAACCRQHAKYGIVNVFARRCSHHALCARQPRCNFDGSKTASFCKKNAVNGMMIVHPPQRCSQTACTRQPAWGLATHSFGTVCSLHKRDIVGHFILNFRARCIVESCQKLCRWGLEGKRSGHCTVHGPFKGGGSSVLLLQVVGRDFVLVHRPAPDGCFCFM